MPSKPITSTTLPLILIILVQIFSVNSAWAADFNVAPPSGQLGLGQELSVSVKINTAGDSVNAAQAKIKFSPNVLEVKSISKEGSIFNFWLQEPVFSNTDGTINFIGGTPNGVSGASLHVLKINFVAKGVGTSEFSFIDASINLAEGSGTNVLGNANGASFTVSTSIAVPKPEKSGEVVPASPIPTPVQIKRTPTQAAGLPLTPAINIPLYPDPAKWYNLVSQFTVSWNLPPDISDLNTAINNNPNFVLPAQSEGLFDSKTYPTISNDGAYYFHIRFKNNVGWGPAAHYRIAIDTQPPLPFKIDVKTGLESDDPSPVLVFKTGDALSGLGSYVIQINNEKLITIDPASLEKLDTGAYKKVQVSEPLELEIIPTGTGFLNVRSQPGLSGSIIAKVKPGETYVYTEENDGWHQIILADGGKGWVSGKYVNLVKGKSEFTSVSELESEYKLKPRKPGAYMIRVRAFDIAGNSVEDRVGVTILPIELPKITSVTEKVTIGTDERLVVKGTSTANVVVSVEEKDKFLVLQSEVITNENGEWEFRLDRELRTGNYLVTVQAKDLRGAVSNPTDAINVKFRDKPIIVFFGLDITLKGLIVIFVLFGVGFAGYYWRKALLHVARAGREAIIIKRDISNMFSQIRKQLECLDEAIGQKRGTSKEKELKHRACMEDVHSSLNKVEKYVSKDIEELK